jgi:hypothetical protein
MFCSFMTRSSHILRPKRGLCPKILLQILVAALCGIGFLPRGFALGQTEFVENTSSKGSFPVAQGGAAADIYVDSADWSGVLRAATDLQADVNRVTALTPKLITDGKGLGKNVIIIGTIGRSTIIDQLIKDKKIDVSKVKGQWEASITQVVPSPMRGMSSALVIAGADKRGTVYGIYNLSEQMGVSPWYFWADVPTPHQDTVFVKAGSYLQGSPSVKYRGIFLNDESPDLTRWVQEKFGTVPTGVDANVTANYGRQFYTNLFELILRIKGNYLWPAMWNNRFSMDDLQNAPLADMYGVVIGTSHQDPMLRSEKEWTWGPQTTVGARNYAQHPKELDAFWREGLVMNSNYEAILTLGLRGAGDQPMIPNATDEQSMDLLKTIFDAQRKIIADVVNPDVTKVPQLWCPYKEVQAYYEEGLRPPDDVTILWAEDNWGDVRRLPTAAERNRPGGAGIYYHFDYHGGPRSYQWLNSSPIAKIWDQLSLAKQYGADRIWIVNVGHFKGYELPMQYFMDLGWNADRWQADNTDDYTRRWSKEQFGAQYADQIAGIMEKYTKFNGRRKPELVDPTTYSVVNYQEGEKVVADYEAIAQQAQEISDKLPEAARPAFYELVLFPAKAAALLNHMYLAAAQNNLYANQGRASAGSKATEVRALFAASTNLVADYNHNLLNGKWDHFMDQGYIGYTSWADPPQNSLGAITLAEPRAPGAPAAPAAATNTAPADARGGFAQGGGFGRRGGRGGAGPRNRTLPDVPEEAAMGVAVEGTDKAFTGTEDSGPVLPGFDSFNGQRHYVEIFNKGKTPYSFTAKASDAWIVLSDATGSVEQEKRIWVSIDWNAAPKGAATGTVTLTGVTNTIAVKVNAMNPTEVTKATLKGFVEGEGVVSIEPEHFSKNSDAGNNRWVRVEDYGRTLSGMRATSPVDVSATPQKDSPCLEYQMYLFSANPAQVDLITSPVLNVSPDRGVQIAVSMDNQAPQMITIIPKGYNQFARANTADWEASVKDNARHVKATLPVDGAGYHTLKVWMVDPGVVVQKVVVDLGGRKPSYLGPPESYHSSAVGQQASLH